MSGAPEGVQAGVFGKLPARGDFVREGLVRDFTDPWDLWWAEGIAGSRAGDAEGWVQAWLEAPVWRFALPPGLCGRQGVLGVWLPSVDKAGRYFPLTLAATAPGDWAAHLPGAEPFLAALEEAGRDALELDATPDVLVQRATAALALLGTGQDGLVVPAGQAAWWTEGGPRVAPRAEAGRSLPQGARFAALIDDGWAAVPQLAVARVDGDAESAA